MYCKLIITAIVGLASFTACAQATRIDLEDGAGTRPQTACSAKITSLLSSADKTRLEFTSNAAKTETAVRQVRLLCAQDGVLDSIKSLDGSTLRIYQSSYYNGGVVLSFVDTSGRHVDMIPFNQRELGELGLTVATLDRVIPFAPLGLAPGLSYRQTMENVRSNAKMIVFYSQTDDCRTVCDGIKDAEMDFCNSVSTDGEKLECRVRAWRNWGGCRTACGK